METLEQITVLAHDEAIKLDSDQLGSLYAQMGETRAETVVCRALEELANRLSLIERSYYRNDAAALAKASKGLIGIADQIGMESLSKVAADVVTLANGTDGPALAAALARLVRLGDRSLTAIWEIQDLNGSL